MNTAKIAAYYPYFCDILKNLGRDYLGRTPVQCLEVKLQADLVAGEKPVYRIELSNRQNGTPRVDLLGMKTTTEFESFVPQRVLAWAKRQLPTSAENTDYGKPWHVSFSMRKLPNGQDSIHTFGCGTQEEVAVLLRGLRAYQRRLTRFTRKLANQLLAYHWQQELATLRKGQWLGAEKAITTAARVDEPGVPFLGDTSLTAEQRRALGMNYWAVPEDAGMSTHFPAGTGIALKQIHRSRELVEGAVYLYQCDWNATDRTMILGRAKLADRSRGSIRLHCDDRPSAFSMPLEWNNPMLKVFRVTHYTTRNAAPATPRLLPDAEFGALSQEPYQQQAQGEELAYAA